MRPALTAGRKLAGCNEMRTLAQRLFGRRACCFSTSVVSVEMANHVLLLCRFAGYVNGMSIPINAMTTELTLKSRARGSLLLNFSA